MDIREHAADVTEVMVRVRPIDAGYMKVDKPLTKISLSWQVVNLIGCQTVVIIAGAETSSTMLMTTLTGKHMTGVTGMPITNTKNKTGMPGTMHGMRKTGIITGMTTTTFMITITTSMATTSMVIRNMATAIMITKIGMMAMTGTATTTVAGKIGTTMTRMTTMALGMTGSMVTTENLSYQTGS